ANLDEDAPPDDSAVIFSAVEKMSLSEAATGLLTQPDRKVDYLDRLVEAGLQGDALPLIANLLCPRDAIGWVVQSGCLAEGEDDPLRLAIQQWIHSELESDRRNVQTRLAAQPPSPGLRWLAQAVVYSGGSLAPDGQPVVQPPAHLPAVAVLTAIRWAMQDESDRPAAMKRWIDSGREWLVDLETQDKE
ncbi:MAG: hypothetical protein MI861_27620, partial [Pirellulales bacterium]|nr:hypothetical protein [Pirellulales bacterium]